MYNGIGSKALLSLPIAFFIGTVLDFALWNPDYEKCLIEELDKRSDELGIVVHPISTPNLGIAILSEVQNESALRKRMESEMELTQNDLDRYQDLRDGLNALATKGQDILDRIKKQQASFEVINFGKFIKINIETEEFILGDSRGEVDADFFRRFGANAPCFNERIGCPIHVGGSRGILHRA